MTPPPQIPLRRAEPSYAALCKPWIEQIREASSHIATMHLDQLRGLSEAAERGAGIYFLWKGPRLQYIGKSRHIYTRLRDHRREQRIPHDRHTSLVIYRGKFTLESVDILLQDAERAYIARYPTPFNSRYYSPST